MRGREMHLHIISRKSAVDAGIKHYFTGMPCVNGGYDLRSTKNAHCKCRSCAKIRCAKTMSTYYSDHEAKKASARQYYSENRELFLSSNKAWYARNREDQIQKMKAYAGKNKEAISARKKEYSIANADAISLANKARYDGDRARFKEISKKYKSENKSVILANCAKRRAIKRERLPAWYGEFDEFVMQESDMLAKERKAATGVKWHVDHMIPLLAVNASGLHCGNNLQVIPAYINNKKKNKMIATEPFEWIKFI